jgi:archaellum component FlaG (FlaF/FlaG flagellin family)
MSEDGMAMNRRFLTLLLITSLAAATTAGCESLRQAIRSSSDDHGQNSVKPTSRVADASAIESDPSKIQAVDSDTKNPQSFFKNNRPSGGWSSEAREIESHLGVGP